MGPSDPTVRELRSLRAGAPVLIVEFAADVLPESVMESLLDYH
jgi:hypothetical protein